MNGGREAVRSSRLFAGAGAALDRLDEAGVLLGVATGKSRRGLLAVLDGHGLADRFVTLQTSELCPGKPRPDMVLRALAEAGVATADAVVVGDTVFDIEMARNAAVASAGVAWGYHAAQELRAAGADALALSFADLPAVVLGLLAGRRPLEKSAAGEAPCGHAG